MSTPQDQPGGAPVGFLTDLNSLEAACVVYLRLWCDGAEAQAKVRADFATALGPEKGAAALSALSGLFDLCARHGRRPLMRHSTTCKCLGSDEACFANFVAAATTGEREDALMIATLLVRADMAPLMTAMASDFGLALKRMHLLTPRAVAPLSPPRSLH